MIFKIGLRNNVKTLFLMLIIDRDERVIWLKNEKVKDTLLYFTKDIAVYLSCRFTGSFL